MALLDFITKRWKGDAEAQDRVVIANASPKVQGDKKPTEVHTKAKHAGMVYNSSLSNKPGSETYSPQEYDMSVIANAIDTDSYFRRAVEKYVELMWKSGYKLVGKNVNAVNYVRRRLEQMAMVTGIPLDETFRQISYQLITYGNTYISKVRDLEASGGKYRRTFTGQLLAPVAGYFVEDVVSMQLAVKKNGEPIGYKQIIPGLDRTKVWRPWNMIHMHYSRKPGLRVGTPLVWPVLDDIRALRKMEQNVELLVFQHTIPLYQYKIGTQDRPAQDVEIDAMQYEIRKMPPHGAIVTPERHEIVAIGAEKKALDVEKYLMYFKARVLAGLGQSAVGMGEGDSSNRGTAQVTDKHMHNTTETFQKIQSMFTNDFMFREILAEGGYKYDAIEEDNKVSLFFPPVDKEEVRAMQNHLAQMYAQHAITETEMRQDSGRDPLEEKDREDMYFERVEAPLAIISAVDEDYPEDEITKTTTATNGNTTTKTTTKVAPKGNAATRQGANRNQPANQFGKAAAAPKFAKNDELTESIFNIYTATKEDVVDTYLDYLKNDEYSIKSIVNVRNSIFKLSKNSITDSLTGAKNGEFVSKRTVEVMDALVDKIIPVFRIENSYEGVVKINSIFEASKHKLDSLCSLVVEGEIDG